MSLALHLKLFHAVRRWHIRRKAIHQLSMLTDHMLHDIGLDRWDIEPAVEEMLRTNLRATDGGGQRRSLPSDAGPSLSSCGHYR